MGSWSTRVPRSALLAAFVTITALGQSSCSPNGLWLSLSSTRLGDPFSLDIAGAPLSYGLLASDIAEGPTLTPFGPVCLALTTWLQTAPFTLDAQGMFHLGGMLSVDPYLNGFERFLQAAA